MVKNTGKLSPKYYTDTVGYSLKSCFNPQKFSSAIGYAALPACLTFSVASNFLAADPNFVDPSPLDKTEISQTYQDAYQKTEAQISLKDAADAFTNIDREIHNARYGGGEPSDILLKKRDLAVVEYDYAEKQAVSEVLLDPRMTEIGLQSYMQDITTKNYEHIDISRRDECLVKSTDGVNAGGNKPAIETVVSCMAEPEEQPRSKSRSVFLSALIGGMASAMGLLLLLALNESWVGHEWKSKPRRQDYLKKGN